MEAKTFFAVILLIAVFCITGTASAMTDSERQALIAQIQAQIAQLTQQLVQLQSQQNIATGTTSWCHTFNINLKQGDSGEEVSALQRALAYYGVYGGGDVQGTFANTTASAVVKFQEKELPDVLISLGLTHGTGIVGSATRKWLNTFYGCATSLPGNVVPTETATEEIPATECAPNWSCTSWSSCTNSQQTRTCTDLNNCGVTTNKPSQTQGCSVACTPACTGKACGADDGCGGKCQTGTCSSGKVCSNAQCVCSSYTAVSWSCTGWSTCTNSQQTRTCSFPAGDCVKASTAKPAVAQSCNYSNWDNPTTPSPTLNCIKEGQFDSVKPDNPSCCGDLYPTKTTQYKCNGNLFILAKKHRQEKIA
jgi:hypothetical protein